MPWWEIALLIYLIPTPITELVTIVVLMMLYDSWLDRKKDRDGKQR